MSDAKHTPGPWRAGTEQGLSYHLSPRIPILRDANGTTYAIGEVSYPTTPYGTNGAEQRAANARLIAAAPELLAALEDMLGGWRYIRQAHGDLYGVGWDRAQDAAEKAIAKAKGES